MSLGLELSRTDGITYQNLQSMSNTDGRWDCRSVLRQIFGHESVNFEQRCVETTKTGTPSLPTERPHDRARANKLAAANKAVEGTKKESFDRGRFKKPYKALRPDDVNRNTAWKSLLIESEYDH